MTELALFELMSEADCELLARSDVRVNVRHKIGMRIVLIAAILSTVLVATLFVGAFAAVRNFKQQHPELQGGLVEVLSVALADEESILSEILPENVKLELGDLIVKLGGENPFTPLGPGESESETESEKEVETKSEIVEGRYPEHNLYYSIKGDFPEYFYLWPQERKGTMISDNSPRYDLYGDITVKVSQEVYDRTTTLIQAEIYIPSEGHQYDNEIGIGMYEDLGLEKYVDGVWTPVAFDGNSHYHFNIMVSSWQYLPPENIPSEGRVQTREIDTAQLYEPLEPGHYRVILFLDDLTCRYGEFDVE